MVVAGTGVRVPWIGNTLRYSRIELVLLWIVVFMMVVKLGT
jgi:hypothetical protein